MYIHMATEKLDTRIRREQIVQAALSLVSAEGLKQLSVARVGKRIGVVPSALYRHFPGKDEILDAMLAEVQARLIENVRVAREEAPDALGRLRALLTRHVALIVDHPGLPRLIFSDDVYSGQPRRRAQMYRGVTQYLDRVAAIVREGQEAGQISPEVDPSAAAVLFLGLVQPPAVLHHLSGGTFDARKQVERTWTLFEAALRNP
jgi:AcrR family transcriptional regulator